MREECKIYSREWAGIVFDCFQVIISIISHCYRRLSLHHDLSFPVIVDRVVFFDTKVIAGLRGSNTIPC